MIVKKDPDDPITELLSCDNLIQGTNINQDQDVQADWAFLQYVTHGLISV